MADIEVEMKQSAFEEMYQKLKSSYVQRLKNSQEAISNILSQCEQGSLSKESLECTRDMAHGLAGSGATFGFPEISGSARRAELSLDKIIKNFPAEKGSEDADLNEIKTYLIRLEKDCQSALDNPEGKNIVTMPVIRKNRLTKTPAILLVDDDEDLSRLLAMQLQQNGFYVSIARNGRAALQCVEERMPNLIILDVSMPVMGGHETLRQLKENSRHAAIPVLMLTANADQSDVVSALHAGALDYIIKPFKPDALLVRVEKMLDRERYTILVADNDHLVLGLLDNQLRQAGFRVILVDDGEKAWNTILKSPPHLAILDQMMPGLEGLDVLKKMRNESKTKDIPVIILSVRNTGNDIGKSVKAGAEEYVIKPFAPDDLIARCVRLIRKTGEKKTAALGA